MLDLPENARPRALGPDARRLRAGRGDRRRPPYDKRPALDVYEVPADGTAIAAAPAGHTLAGVSRRFEAWGRC